MPRYIYRLFLLPEKESHMISKTFTAQTQYSDPLFVPRGKRAIVMLVESTASLVATFEIQIFQKDKNTNLPTDSSAWRMDEEIDIINSDPVTRVSKIDNIWVRVVLPTGNYTSGQALCQITLGDA